MGAAYKEVCYTTALEAAEQLCAESYPRTDVNAAGDVRSLSCSVLDGTTLAIASAVGTTATSTEIPVSFAACDPDKHYNEVAAIWAVGTIAIALVVIWRMAMAPLTTNQ